MGGNTTIGGTTGTTPGGNCTGACNLISGNGQNGIVSNGNTLVQGNYIGTDVMGKVKLGNTLSGVVLSNGSNGLTVGGTTPAARNLISGNNEHGVYLIGGGATVQGNYIGTNAKGYIDTDATGINDLGNAQTGVVMANFSANNLIGGTEEGARNLISGNNGDGICACSSIYSPSTNTIRGNLIGTDETGKRDRGNTGNGISTGGGSVVVDGLIISGNTISGNDGAGINSTTPATIKGNYIGTDITGLLPLGNGLSGGIYINGGINVIGGTDTGASNVISANSGNGITIKTGATQTVQGNYIGTNKDGLTGSGLGNNLNGIKLGDAGQGVSNVTIGGNTDAARNVIAGNNQNGIELTNSSSNINIKGNYIGQNTQNGVQATQVNSANGVSTIGGTAGEGNTITGNGENGVQVRTTIGVAIRGNAIYDNTKLGIDLAPTLPGGTVTPNDAGDGDGGSNLLQNFPVLNAITQPCTITGSLDSTTTSAAYPVRIEFFANTACDTTGNGEGEVYLDFVVLNAPGSFSRSFTPVAGKNVITATATDNNGNTSEFSACRTAPVNQAPVIAPASVARTEGQPGANSTIANITDTNQASNTLGITINGQPISPSPTVTVAGVTISNLALNAAGALTADVVAACGATSASFALAATDNCGLTTPGALTVTVNPAPAPMANAGIDQAMCSAGATTAFTLAGSAANGVAAWSVVSGPVSITNPGALNPTAVFAGAGTATLRLNVTGSCGAATDDVVLTVNPPPVATITASGPTTFCQGGSVTLTASAANSYAWSNGATTPSITVNAAGSYSVTVTDGNVCTGTSAATAVTVSPLPTPTITASGPTTFCQGGSVTLTASPASSYAWSNGATTPSITVNAAGSYSPKFCANRATIHHGRLRLKP